MMRKKTLSLIATFTLVTASSVFAQAKKEVPDQKVTAAPAKAAEPEPEEKKWYEAVDFSGFVDVYYMYNNNPLQGNAIDATHAFETSNKNFGVNAAALAIQKTAEKGSPWGFRVDFQNGQNNAYQEAPYTTSNQVYNYNMLKQAYVSMYFPVLKGMTLDIGKMATHIGYEVLESMNNPNYTIGAIFQNTIPFIHTGARLTTQFTDKWAGTFYLYNSGGGTGYTSPTPGNLTSTTTNSFFESSNEHKAVGTQLKGTLIEDKLSLTWNTLYSSDGFASGYTGVVDPSQMLVANYLETGSVNGAGTVLPTGQRMKYNKDYWFMNHAILSITPTDRIQIDLDYTWSEKSGAMANANLAQQQYNSANVYTAETVLGGQVNTSHNKSSYQSYGVFSKFKITETWGVNVRIEYLNDKANNGQLNTFSILHGPNASSGDPTYTSVNGGNGYLGAYQQQINTALAEAIKASNPIFAGLTDNQILAAIDPKNYKNYSGAAANYGQYRTFTVTPVWNFTENLLIKLDLRRDWATGYQFIDIHGDKRKDQLGLTLGVVAKF
ncbi:outer membrane beta-barrel protein [Leptospira langatensis]|nr:outer membrane beta-barrel protein [Leptospira langatensis]